MKYVLNVINLLIISVTVSFPSSVAFASVSTVPKFAEMKNTELKKRAFIDFLVPIITEINQDILTVRTRLVSLHKAVLAKRTLTKSNEDWVNLIAKDYRVSKFNLSSERKWNELLRRVDIVPVSLVLAQAANESAWGTSRFARNGNNYFGQWCFTTGCGIVPKNRTAGQKHELQRFSSVKAAVQSYVHNLNTHLAYKGLRIKRLTLRNSQKNIKGVILANGLGRYSDKGRAYIRSIQRLIEMNQLDNYKI